MIARGIGAVALRDELTKLIEKHGDRPVVLATGDYPGAAEGVVVETKGDGYKPKGWFIIWSQG
jgi:hypothetical protein